jgi:hypothetical protein
MFFQTVLQILLGRKKPVEPQPQKELSPMAQSIMQKLAEHDKAGESEQKDQPKIEKHPKSGL